MKKRSIGSIAGMVITAGVLIALIIVGVVFFRGKVSNCEIANIESSVYTDEDYKAACKVAFSYFRNHFGGCTMTAIRYAGDDDLEAMQEWAEEYGVDEVIILESDFKTENKYQSELNPNSDYTDWNWILARNKGGRWKHKDHGYE